MSNQLFKSKEFNFQKLGIGGLDDQFEQIFRRAFASRVFPPSVVEKLGIHHVKGVLLHGPPGTGETLPNPSKIPSESLLKPLINHASSPVWMLACCGTFSLIHMQKPS